MVGGGDIGATWEECGWAPPASRHCCSSLLALRGGEPGPVDLIDFFYAVGDGELGGEAQVVRPAGGKVFFLIARLAK